MTLFEVFMYAPFALIPILLGVVLRAVGGDRIGRIGEILVVAGIIWGVLVGFVVPYVPFAVPLRLP